MMWGYGWSWPMGLWMVIGSLFWLAVLGVVIWALVRLLSHHTETHATSPMGRTPTALDILQQRFARGEIDATTFEQMRERLEAGNTAVGEARGAQEHRVL